LSTSNDVYTSSHQRFDVLNYGQIGQLAVGFLAQWVAFHRGMGLYSLLVAAVASTLCGFIMNAWAVFLARVAASKGSWGRPTYAIFKHLFSFGGELLLLSIGFNSPMPARSSLFRGRWG